MSAQEPERYFDHDADIGIVGRGGSLEQSFESAAQAMFAVMGNVSAPRSDISVGFEFEEEDVELALVTWLNLLLAYAREQGALFSSFHLRRSGNTWFGEAGGEPWRAGMERGVEVKGATLTMLSVRQQDGHWEARCVVDV